MYPILGTPEFVNLLNSSPLPTPEERFIRHLQFRFRCPSS